MQVFLLRVQQRQADGGAAGTRVPNPPGGGDEAYCRGLVPRGHGGLPAGRHPPRLHWCAALSCLGTIPSLPSFAREGESLHISW